MRVATYLACLIALALGGTSRAQEVGAKAALPPLMECGVHGDIEILCGTRSPEDLELAPDGKYLFATQFVNRGRGRRNGDFRSGEEDIQQDC